MNDTLKRAQLFALVSPLILILLMPGFFDNKEYFYANILFDIIGVVSENQRLFKERKEI